MMLVHDFDVTALMGDDESRETSVALQLRAAEAVTTRMNHFQVLVANQMIFNAHICPLFVPVVGDVSGAVICQKLPTPDASQPSGTIESLPFLERAVFQLRVHRQDQEIRQVPCY